MYRRHLLVLLVGAAAGCSSQSAGPTATAEPTRTAPATDTPSPTATADVTASPASPTDDTATATGGVDAVVAGLNEVYADLAPALETLETSALDTDALAGRLETVREEIARQQDADGADAERLQSLSDTRWIFDRLVRTFVRFEAAYDVHEDLDAAYRASEATDETTTQLERFKILADEAANASGTAVSRYDAMASFDPALDVDYAAFREPMFRVSDAANALTPLARGLEAAIPARQRYRRAVGRYEEGAYREARNTFADLINTFSDAIDRFERAEGLDGPLRPPFERYRCEVDAGRIACVDYRAACREQLEGNADSAERRRNQAERRGAECPAGTATPSG